MTRLDHNSPLRADFRHVIYALADALDLVGIDDQGHGKRVGIMAVECARELGFDTAATSFLFDLGLLHDIGVSSTVIHGHLVSEFDWSGSQVHCEVGYRLLRDFAPLARLAEPVRHHHTRWDALVAQSIPEEIAKPANLIYLVDRVDALASAYVAKGGALMHTQAIRERISANSGTYFCPELVEGFLAASSSEAFWLNLEPRGIQAFLADMLEQGQHYAASITELKQLATIFSRIVDAKSPFTAEHSLGVANLSRFFAERLGVSEENCDKLEIAGLLHDIGKLRVPDEILDKPAKLDESERTIMNTHSFETYQILRLIPGFEEIAPWAAYHHEEPDGSGYPFRLSAGTLPLEAQILRVADIFQAMVQDRPYRAGLSAESVRQFMEELISKGRIDRDIFAVAANDMTSAMAAALPGKA
jgi:putative nucleotidyltransferase with HDIG domain